VFDVERARAGTPGCAERIHLNNAGAALMTRSVLDTQIDHLELEGRIGGYEAAAARSDQVAAVYESIGTLIGADPDEIALVENATVAWNQAFGSIPLRAGDVVITSEAEYGANYVAYLKAVRDRGIEIRVVPGDPAGVIDIGALGGAIDGRTRLIAVTHVPTNGGLVNPAAEIAGVAHRAGVPFLLDAAQSIGQIDIDVEEIGCDFLATTGRKFLRGPRGTGFLWASRKMMDQTEPPVIDHFGGRWVATDRYELRNDARRYENWEFNYAAVLGLGAATDEALDWGMPAIEARVATLADLLRCRLTEEGFEVFDLGTRRCAIVTTLIPGMAADTAKEALSARDINVSVTTPDSTRLDAERRSLPDLLRLSVHYFNTEDELEEAVSALTDLRRG